MSSGGTKLHFRICTTDTQLHDCKWLEVTQHATIPRAFACATVHDMFNWLTVIIMVIVESATGFLETITAAMVASLGDTSGNQKPPDFLKVLTNPFTKAIVKLDKKVGCL